MFLVRKRNNLILIRWNYVFLVVQSRLKDCQQKSLTLAVIVQVGTDKSFVCWNNVATGYYYVLKSHYDI